MIEEKLELLKKVIDDTIGTVMGSEYAEIMMKLSEHCVKAAIEAAETQKIYRGSDE